MSDGAPDLLGCVLECDSSAGPVAVRVTEVEAYRGLHDPASHAYRRKSLRNGVMFGPPGYAYVYQIYGLHFCVNLVCQPEGTAEAVLVRAGEVVTGTEVCRLTRWMTLISSSTFQLPFTSSETFFTTSL